MKSLLLKIVQLCCPHGMPSWPWLTPYESMYDGVKVWFQVCRVCGHRQYMLDCRWVSEIEMIKWFESHPANKRTITRQLEKEVRKRFGVTDAEHARMIAGEIDDAKQRYDYPKE